MSKALKIRKDHLEALEEDRIEALPGRTYAVGFVRTYADYLGLDAPQAVERFKSQIAGRTDDATPTITVIDEDEHRRLPQGWKIIAAFVLLAFAYGAYHLLATDKISAPPVAAVPQAAVAPKPPPKRVVKIEPLPQPATPAAAPNAQAPGAAQTATPDATQQQAHSRRARSMARRTKPRAWFCASSSRRRCWCRAATARCS